MTRLPSADQQVAILGAGREGRAAAAYLRSRSPEVRLTLLSESQPDAADLQKIDPRDRLVVGPLSQAGLEKFDLLVRSPGISVYREELIAARRGGVRITTPSSLWFDAHQGARTICVTGTKGKSTTSAMIAHMLKACGLKVQLAGNIGWPLLDCDDSDVDWWVIELSSYQLADLEGAPTIGVLLNLSAEHLDWHGSIAAYRHDKLRLARLCAGSRLIANAEDDVLRDSLSDSPDVNWFNSPESVHVSGREVRLLQRRLPVRLPENLPGRHNLSNAAAALAAVAEAGVDIERAARSLTSFRGLPHRLQLIGERGGVQFINDSISSTPVSTVAAVEALTDRAIILIVGGLDRGLDWSPYMEAFQVARVKAVVGVPDSGPTILAAMSRSGLTPERGLHQANSLADAAKLAGRLAGASGLVLLSPGAPSFPRFRDYRDRGRQFTRACGFEFEEWDIA